MKSQEDSEEKKRTCNLRSISRWNRSRLTCWSVSLSRGQEIKLVKVCADIKALLHYQQDSIAGYRPL
jgi:hypothetical protein